MSSVEAYSQGHISSKDADRVHAIVVRFYNRSRVDQYPPPPNLLKTLVGNRVSQIQQLSKDFQWKLISLEGNPADVISCELEVKELATNNLRWKGPDLQNIAEATPNSLRVSSTVTDQCYTNELKPMSKVTLKLNIDSNFIDNLDRTNNFQKLIRILASIFRFIKNCKPVV
ncbi:integrase_H2C2 domain-containing protein [Trichonephila clavata]|uniref:Integrase_H2C2 domain-containing protein n=1 Tax=Trichonephila clavata TaxID=2740835 RepID=A0A8X6LBY0_TRICU|nr:integrase_H2C2 domain-containing protein [Trichonephila clavata]